MHSLPTDYGGVRFRSRLEARWAVFFDSLDIDWRYEAEGADLSGMGYLIDFALPQFGLLVEIKGSSPDEIAIEKCTRLAENVTDRVRLLYGDIGWWRWGNWLDSGKGGGVGFWREQEGAGWIGQADLTPPLYCPCVCPECGMFGIEHRGSASRLKCGHVKSDKVLTGDAKRIQVAILAATRFQFDIDPQPGMPAAMRGE